MIDESERRETEKERLDRNLLELMGEVRVALPGVQVLFAFLLLLPFQVGFDDATDFQRAVYFSTLSLTALATVLLIAPTARHRARFRTGDKDWVVSTGNRLAFAALGCLGLAMAGAILLISDVLFSLGAAIAASSALIAVLGWFWFAAALLRSRDD